MLVIIVNVHTIVIVNNHETNLIVLHIQLNIRLAQKGIHNSQASIWQFVMVQCHVQGGLALGVPVKVHSGYRKYHMCWNTALSDGLMRLCFKIVFHLLDGYIVYIHNIVCEAFHCTTFATNVFSFTKP